MSKWEDILKKWLNNISFSYRLEEVTEELNVNKKINKRLTDELELSEKKLKKARFILDKTENERQELKGKQLCTKLTDQLELRFEVVLWSWRMNWWQHFWCQHMAPCRNIPLQGVPIDWLTISLSNVDNKTLDLYFLLGTPCSYDLRCPMIGKIFKSLRMSPKFALGAGYVRKICQGKV